MFLFIDDDNDEDDQRYKTCLTARARERETAEWLSASSIMLSHIHKKLYAMS